VLHIQRKTIRGKKNPFGGGRPEAIGPTSGGKGRKKISGGAVLGWEGKSKKEEKAGNIIAGRTGLREMTLSLYPLPGKEKGQAL